MEAVNLCIASVGGTVLLLDLEKEVLRFAQRTELYGGGEFFYNARDLRLAFGEILAFRSDCCLACR